MHSFVSQVSVKAWAGRLIIQAVPWLTGTQVFDLSLAVSQDAH